MKNKVIERTHSVILSTAKNLTNAATTAKAITAVAVISARSRP